jgi:hypothetical protein
VAFARPLPRGKGWQWLVLPYNPERLTRRQVRGNDGRLTEWITLVVTLDATDGLERGETAAAQHGVEPTLAALEDFAAGVDPVVLCWGARRIPVRIERVVVIESLFDHRLTTVRATAALSLRVCTPDDTEGEMNRVAAIDRRRRHEAVAGNWLPARRHRHPAPQPLLLEGR